MVLLTQSPEITSAFHYLALCFELAMCRAVSMRIRYVHSPSPTCYLHKALPSLLQERLLFLSYISFILWHRNV